jgi:hypothetical protein
MDVAAVLANSSLGTILTLAAVFLILGAVVQILQESYKYLSRSEARTYRKVLVDFAGPWIEQLYQPGLVNDLQLRNPWQIRKVRPRGVLLPMPKDQLIQAVERLAPVWSRRTLEQLRLEHELQTSVMEPVWSPDWRRLVNEMRDLDEYDPTHWDSERVLEFIDTWVKDTGKEGTQQEDPWARARSYDARALLVAFHNQFIPAVVKIEQYFPQLERNLEYSYHRRNLRQIFAFAVLVALLFFVPLSELLAQISQPSLEGSIAFASAGIVLGKIGLLPIVAYVLNLFIMVLLISFGAFFWHNLTSALWRAGRVWPRLPVHEEK